jgi:hypothetical protein
MGTRVFKVILYFPNKEHYFFTRLKNEEGKLQSVDDVVIARYPLLFFVDYRTYAEGE